MKVHYRCSEYISYKRAGDGYKKCLAALGHSLVPNPAESDLVILHGEPGAFDAWLRAMPPKPGRKTVGYAVWETPELPKAYAEAVRPLDAVWTCSEFSRAAFAPYARTFVLPHVVERGGMSPGDLLWARERLGAEEKGPNPFYYFYTVMDTVNPRKNAETLLAAFMTAFPDGEGARLVVKQYRQPRDLSTFPGVIDIPEFLSDGRMAALHAVCDACVSAHHAEAWGLPLSEALAFGNPVIATGYSGNMEFMNEANSFPVPYTITRVSGRICQALPGLFRPDMTWADIDANALVRAMRRVRRFPPDAEFRRRAAASVRRFSQEAVTETMRSLLAAL